MSTKLASRNFPGVRYNLWELRVALGCSFRVASAIVKSLGIAPAWQSKAGKRRIYALTEEEFKRCAVEHHRLCVRHPKMGRRSTLALTPLERMEKLWADRLRYDRGKYVTRP